MARRGGTDADRRARGEETRRLLVDAARALFAQRGFLSTSIGEIVDRSGVGTRGAFYHHFADKTAVFRAVYEDVEGDLVLRSIANPEVGEPWETLVRGLHGFLTAALDPEVRQVMLIDAPAVLGWETRRAIEDANSIAVIEAILRGAMAAGTIDELPARELAHMVAAAIEEGAMLVAHSDDVEAATDAAGRILDRLLLGLLPTPAVARPKRR